MKPFLVCLLFFISTTLAFKNETEFHHRSRRQNYIWNVLKQFSFTDVNQIRTDWDIMKWSPGTVNEEKQAYVDDGTTLSIKRDTGNQCYLTLRAYRQGKNLLMRTNENK